MYKTILSSCALAGLLSAGLSANPLNDPNNVYRYFKDTNDQCLITTNACNQKYDVTQFKKGRMFTSSQYGQSSDYRIDVNGDGILDHVSKYSGTLGFGSKKHSPIAIENNGKVYFVYSGPVTLDGYEWNSKYNEKKLATTGENNSRRTTSPEFYIDKQTNKRAPVLGIYVSVYNPITKKVKEPVLVHAKWTDDFHDNAVINKDDRGYVYIVISGRNTARRTLIYRSEKPNDISSFVDITPNISQGITYPHIYWTNNGYFRFIYTVYNVQRHTWTAELHTDGSLKNSKPIANFKGHYSIANGRGNDIVIAFNSHLKNNGGVDDRTNLYYLHSKDGGETWLNSKNGVVTLPLSSESKLDQAAVREYYHLGNTVKRRIYLKDINFDGNGENKTPYIVVAGVLGSNGFQPSKTTDHYIATWTASATGTWTGKRLTNSIDHAYSSAAIYNSASELKVIYAETEEANNNALAGGAIAVADFSETSTTGNAIVSTTNTGPLDGLCEFNNIRPVYSDSTAATVPIAVATSGNQAIYAEYNPLIIVHSDSEVRQLPATFTQCDVDTKGACDVDADGWINTTAIIACNNN